MKNRARSAVGIIAFSIALLTLLESQLYAEAKGDASDFKDTAIVAHPEVPLAPHGNAIWCDVSSLAWNEAIALLKGPLEFQPSIPLATLLNRQEYTKADLDDVSYVAMAGYGEPVKGRIADALQAKFGPDVKSDIVPTLPPLDPKQFLAFAFLYKNLVFPTVFNENVPLQFGGQPVANFGFNLEKNRATPKDGLLGEVRVLSYKSDDDFVIQLRTKSAGDQLILAKVAPGNTLVATMNAVIARASFRADWGVDKDDLLAVPKIDFDLLTHFKDLEDKTTTSDITIDKFLEKVRFRLNEKGALLKAEAVIMATASMARGPQPEPKRLIFDQPFLVLLKRESSPRPYFAMWVGNPQLLVAP